MYKYKETPLKDIKRNIKKTAKSERITLSHAQMLHSSKLGFVSWANFIKFIKNNFELSIFINPKIEGSEVAEVKLTHDSPAIAIGGDLGDGKTFVAIEVAHQAINQGWHIDYYGTGSVTQETAEQYLDHRLLHDYQQFRCFSYHAVEYKKGERIEIETSPSKVSKDTHKLVIIDQAARVLDHPIIVAALNDADAALLLTSGEPLRLCSGEEYVPTVFTTALAKKRHSQWKKAFLLVKDLTNS